MLTLENIACNRYSMPLVLSIKKRVLLNKGRSVLLDRKHIKYMYMYITKLAHMSIGHYILNENFSLKKQNKTVNHMLMLEV